MYLCDFCVAKLVVSGRMLPLSIIWGPNQVPSRRGKCDQCKRECNTLWCCPEYEIKKVPYR